MRIDVDVPDGGVLITGTGAELRNLADQLEAAALVGASIRPVRTDYGDERLTVTRLDHSPTLA